MGLFRVIALSQSGVAVLESDDGQAVKNKLDLYKDSKRAAVVVDTIASVRDPLYLAAPLIALRKGDTLTPKR